MPKVQSVKHKNNTDSAMDSLRNARDDMSPLTISNISKSFDGRRVLDGISITLNEGEIFGLIGLNGIGKTTLIKIILDLFRADSGEVKIFGEDSSNVLSRKKLVYLPEKFMPSKYLKGHDYLSLNNSYYNIKYDKKVAEKEAESLGLDTKVLDKLVASYSKGMAQKLGLIGAIMSNTPLMILDEPMSGLDPKARIMLKDRLLRLKEDGRTIFFSSHILADIDEICDRIGVLNDGKMIFIGTTKEFRKIHNNDNLERAFLNAINA